MPGRSAAGAGGLASLRGRLAGSGIGEDLLVQSCLSILGRGLSDDLLERPVERAEGGVPEAIGNLGHPELLLRRVGEDRASLPDPVVIEESDEVPEAEAG